MSARRTTTAFMTTYFRYPRRMSPFAGTALLALFAACGGNGEPDAYGTFEAVEVVVAAETPGRLLAFTAVEGASLAAGAAVGLVDTIELALERRQIEAQRSTASARVAEAARQIALLETEREIATRVYERTARLHAQQAATSLHLDQAERDYRSLGERIDVVRAQQRTAASDVATVDARMAQMAERIRRSTLVNPASGTVLTTYVEPGEFVQPGQPLYTIANLDTLTLRAYVAEPDLARVRLGAGVRVTIDAGRTHRVLPGTVRWVSAQAEFTPTPIQTRDERADLVYAIKIAVANPEGAVKVGMPADVQFEVTPAP